jgi:FeS assembly protein IscX
MCTENSLSWDDTYEIVQSLNENHPAVNFEELSLGTLYEWIVALPQFKDDPSVVHDEILIQIFSLWYEEVNK